MEVNQKLVKDTIQKNKCSTQRNFPLGHQPGKKSVFDRKTPQNREMQKVQRKVHTGTTVRDVEVMTNSQISRRKNEIFRRLSPVQLMTLIDQVRNSNTESIYNIGQEDQVSVVSNQTPLAPALAQSNFLLLDMRDPASDFSIKESTSFPLRLLKQDRMLPDMIRFKNKMDKMIIVYGLDEREGMTAANLLSQKDIENVFLLTEGIEKFACLYPEFVDGVIPLQISMAKDTQPKKVLRGTDKQQSLKRDDLSNLDDKMSVMSMTSGGTKSSWMKKSTIRR